ncbi:hypothetical protein GWI33_007393 [Rhynchophorus ferrugineus]|uniref:RNA (guanine-9-)-methyltransferase domain-containing protein 1 n=1 Tax=Rhynchophorus ferrugineus TaxID=354439 RepID=A0A834ITL2_RHYFE|nr:hypothetical protein GWI33_007393 [Rhynchophorus ferrugineus]
MFVISKSINRIGTFGSNVLKKCVFVDSDKILSCHVGLLKRSFPYKTCFTKVSDISNSNTTSAQSGDEQSGDHTVKYVNITKGNKELEHKLKILMLEVEVLRQQGDLVPPNTFFKDEHWGHLLSLQTRTSRRKYLSFLFKLSKKKENEKAKKLERQREKKEFLALNPKETNDIVSIEEHATKYELQYNSLFLRFFDTKINNFYNKKLIDAIPFEQKLVIDCGYDQDMTSRENRNCAKQLMFLFAENRMHSDPFDIHYANYNKESEIATALLKYIPTLYDSDFPTSVHEKSYLDVFPKEKLIYLTPHCRQEMEIFDHDAVYIIGGIVDKVNNEPLSLAKAKKEGIKMLKFPLDKYLLWGAGSGKSLTLNQCVAILLDLRTTGNWEYALRHVPRRKLLSIENNKDISQFKKDKTPIQFKRQYRIQKSNK